MIRKTYEDKKIEKRNIQYNSLRQCSVEFLHWVIPVVLKLFCLKLGCHSFNKYLYYNQKSATKVKNYATDTFYSNYTGANICCNYTVRNFCNIYAGESFCNKYLGDNFHWNYACVSLLQYGSSIFSSALCTWLFLL